MSEHIFTQEIEESLLVRPPSGYWGHVIRALLSERGSLLQKNEALQKQANTTMSALGGMVEQYCDWKDEEIGDCYFHMFMGAPETAFEVLENAGLLECKGRENYVFTAAWKELERKVGW